MPTLRRILLTTTSSLDGWEVSEYIGPVSAQFVIGTGFFTDFVSQFTDFFGAHSHSYQQKLDRIHQEALDQIAEKAQRLGGSVVLGLRVDHDEISGAGKSMMMVTASGTAAKARQINKKAGDELTPLLEGLLTGQEMRIRMRLHRAVELAKERRLKWSDKETWGLVIENQGDELTDAFVNHVEGVFRRDEPSQVSDIKQRFEEYFVTLPREVALRNLYDCLPRDEQLFSIALKLIKQLNGFDGQRIIKLVLGDDLLVAQRALALVEAEQMQYDPTDEDKLAKLASAIEARFRPSTLFESKGFFGSKQMWKCECGREFDQDVTRCNYCRRDRWGFTPKMLNPEKALQIIRTKLDILRSEMSQQRNS